MTPIMSRHSRFIDSYLPLFILHDVAGYGLRSEDAVSTDVSANKRLTRRIFSQTAQRSTSTRASSNPGCSQLGTAGATQPTKSHRRRKVTPGLHIDEDGV